MQRILKVAAVVIGAGTLVGAACTARAPEGTSTGDTSAASANTTPVSNPTSPEPDTLRIARLEREARALASVKGCDRASDCRTAPVGAKACGGPRSYIVYCAATTDTVKLFAKLRELERVETAWNAKAGIISNCIFHPAPSVALVAGSCREVNGAP